MQHITRVLVLVVTMALAAIGLTIPAHAAADRDCGDFSSQQQAQNFFVSQGGPSSDPHRLDADDDGQACDTLPCPCGASAKPKPKPAAVSKPKPKAKPKAKPAAVSKPKPKAKAKAKPKKTKAQKILRQRGNVVKVLDGDTVRVRIKKKNVDVRMLGINAPESRQCYADRATVVLRRMLPVGSQVALASDGNQPRKDGAGRLLRYVTKGKTDVNRSQLLNGSARVFAHGGKPFARVKSYDAAQSGARSRNAGQWTACKPPVPPRAPTTAPTPNPPPTPDPAPDPDPVPEPDPAPDPDPVPEPDPAPDPDPVPEPDPAPAPQPEP